MSSSRRSSTSDHITWTSGLDSRGVPKDRFEPKIDEPTLICPNFFGSRSWNQATFNPKTGFLYNIGIEWCGEFTGAPAGNDPRQAMARRR